MRPQDSCFYAGCNNLPAAKAVAAIKQFLLSRHRIGISSH